MMCFVFNEQVLFFLGVSVVVFVIVPTPAEPALCNLLGTRKSKGTAPGGPRRRRPRSGLAGGARGAGPPEAQERGTPAEPVQAAPCRDGSRRAPREAPAEGGFF